MREPISFKIETKFEIVRCNVCRCYHTIPNTGCVGALEEKVKQLEARDGENIDDIRRLESEKRGLGEAVKRLHALNNALMSALTAAMSQAWGDSGDIVTVEDGDKITVVLERRKGAGA